MSAPALSGLFHLLRWVGSRIRVGRRNSLGAVGFGAFALSEVEDRDARYVGFRCSALRII
ncbi:hypothetical protein [Fodinibius sp. Rm-B-1B1-1]|uniref:hypothetical protein n=1 Tax=Fodinibius alkaliphilus TaxID=3140241 RepID=UPI00315A3A9F